MPDHSKLLHAAKIEVTKLREKRRTRWAADVMERLVAIIEGETVSPDNPETPRPEHAPQDEVVAAPKKAPARKKKGTTDGTT